MIIVLLAILVIAVVLMLPEHDFSEDMGGYAFKTILEDEATTTLDRISQEAPPAIMNEDTERSTDTFSCNNPPEYSETGETIYIYSGSGKVASMKEGYVSFHHSDYLGSANAITDQCGNKRWSTDYYPFGAELKEEKITTDNDYTYTGKEYDEEMDLYYYGARYYDPVTGRFTQLDPLYVVDMSPYAYSNNRPLVMNDPTGMVATLGMENIGQGMGAGETYLTWEYYNNHIRPITDVSHELTSTDGEVSESTSITRGLSYRLGDTYDGPVVSAEYTESTSAPTESMDVVKSADKSTQFSESRGGSIGLRTAKYSFSLSGQQGQTITPSNAKARDTPDLEGTQRSAHLSIGRKLNDNIRASAQASFFTFNTERNSGAQMRRSRDIEQSGHSVGVSLTGVKGIGEESYVSLTTGIAYRESQTDITTTTRRGSRTTFLSDTQMNYDTIGTLAAGVAVGPFKLNLGVDLQQGAKPRWTGGLGLSFY